MEKVEIGGKERSVSLPSPYLAHELADLYIRDNRRACAAAVALCVRLFSKAIPYRGESLEQYGLKAGEHLLKGKMTYQEVRLVGEAIMGAIFTTIITPEEVEAELGKSQHTEE